MNEIPSVPSLPGSGTLPGLRKNPLLALILALALISRVLICWSFGLAHIHTDSHMYLTQAAALEAGRYINYAPNGYPILIALIKSLAPGSWLIPLLLGFNILFGVLSVYFIYVIGSKAFNDHRVALIAAFILAIYPNQINYTRWILTEAPSAFVILAAYYFYIRDQRFLSGIWFGLASILRPTLIPVLPALILLDWIRKRRFPLRMTLGGALITLTLGFYCMAKTGSFSIAGNSAVNILYSVYSYGGHIAWEAPRQHPGIKTSSQAESLYFREASKHPIYFIKQRLASLWELWGPVPDNMNGTRGLGSRIIIGLGNAFLILFGLWGWWRNRKKPLALALILPFVIITGIHTMMLSIARYTVPAEPFLILFAADSCYRILMRFRPLRHIEPEFAAFSSRQSNLPQS